MSGSLGWNRKFSSLDPFFKQTGTPTMVNNSLSANMLFYAVDTGLNRYDSIISPYVMSPIHYGSNGTNLTPRLPSQFVNPSSPPSWDPDSTLTTTSSTTYGQAIVWPGKAGQQGGFNGTSWENGRGSICFVDGTIVTAMTLSGQANGSALTIGCTFNLIGDNPSDKGQLFGRPIRIDDTGYGICNMEIDGGGHRHPRITWLRASSSDPLSSSPATITSTTECSINTIYTLIATFEVVSGHVNVNLYLNGSNVASTSASECFGNTGDNEDQIQFGTQFHSYAGQSFGEIKGSVYQGFMATRKWSGTEITNFSNSPFQLLSF